MLLAILAVSAAAAAPPPPSRVLVLDVKSTSMDETQIAAVTQLLTHELANKVDARAFSVVGVRELRRAAAVEADKQDAGCADASCVTELAGAYAAELVVFAEDAAFGTSHVVTLQLWDAKRATALARASISVDGGAGAVLGEIPRAAAELAGAARATRDVGVDGGAPVGDDASGASDNIGAIVGFSVAGGAAVIGGIALFSGAVVLTTPTDPDQGPLGFGLFGAGLGMLGVVTPAILLTTWWLTSPPTR